MENKCTKPTKALRTWYSQAMPVTVRYLSAQDAANRLGVHPNTVRNWGKRGVLHPTRLPGSNHRRFDAEEVERLANEMRLETNPLETGPPPAVGPELVDASYLHEWGARRDAQEMLPRLVRRLLAATPGATGLSVRAGEGVALGGWDGQVEISQGTPWVPAGESRWEFGAGGRPKEKAQADYDKRTSNPLGTEPSTATFVFVTPRRWAGKDRWVSDRRADRIWGDVRVLDADDLEAWLENMPAVHVWLSEHLGRRPHEVRTLESWWRRFAGQTQPPLPPTLVLASRETQADELREALCRPPAAVGIQAGSREEAQAFLAAAVAVHSPNRSEADRPVVVVSSPAAWERMAGPSAPTVLVPAFESAGVAWAVMNGHHVVVPLGTGDVSRNNAISLPRLGRQPAREALSASGVPFERADRLAGLGRRSFASLVRELAVDPLRATPEWAQHSAADLFGPLLLLGAWENKDADQEIVAEFLGIEWSILERRLAGWAATDDPPLTRSGGEWRLSSPEEAWAQLNRALTVDDILRFRVTVERVLGEQDPALDLAPSERPYAALQGTSRTFSEALRSGVAQGIALLGALGNEPLADGTTGAEHARWLVRGLLERANQDGTGRLWQSLASELPLLAEGAPEAFLDAVETGLTGERPLLVCMFGDAEHDSWIYASSHHTGLIWALEGLCWSPLHVSRSALLLARLADVDPGGRLSNRPAASLRAIFLPWLPRTAATLDRRLSTLDAMRERFPTIAWPLLLGLLPRTHDTSWPTHNVRFADWKPEREHPTTGEWLQTVSEVVGRVIADAADDPWRWAELVDRLDELPPDQRTRVLATLESVDFSSTPLAGRVTLWRHLTDLAAQYRSLRNAEWSMGEEAVARVETAAAQIEPIEAVERHARLFDWLPALPGVDPFDHEAFEEALAKAREAAIHETFELAGPDGLIRLAEESTVPGIVGTAAALAIDDDLSECMLPLLGRGGHQEVLATGWVSQTASRRGWQWVERVAEGLLSSAEHRAASFLLALPADARSFDLVMRASERTTKRYWRSLSPWAVQAPVRQIAVERLLQFERPWAAVAVLTTVCRAQGDEAWSPQAELIQDVLHAALRAKPASDITMASFEVGVLLDYLENSGTNAGTLGQLEWSFFDLLDDTREPRALYAALACDPALFVDLVFLVFRGKNEERRTPDESSVALAGHAWRVLEAWRSPPGSNDEGMIDADELRGWVQQARELLAAGDRLDIGDQQIGQLLSGSPAGADEIWPAEAVRELVEEISSEHLETGLHVGKANARGVTSRGIYDGGNQERSLAASYRVGSDRVQSRWPRTARLLRGLAESYEAEALREDADAARSADSD
jgi:excisionase family DNA binding protein